MQLHLFDVAQFLGCDTMARQQKQLGVGFPPVMREALQKAADEAGRSVGEEIRRRVEQSFLDETAPAHLRRLFDGVARFTDLIKKQTGGDWSVDPVAARTLRAAIDAYLERRYGAQSGGKTGEMTPEQIGKKIESDDFAVVQSIERSLEALDANLKEMQNVLPMAGPGRAQLEQTIRTVSEQREYVRMLLRFPDGKKA